MRSSLIFLPSQCDRPILTILDGLDGLEWRSVLSIARRCGHDVYHVCDELRKMVAAGQADVLNIRHGPDEFEFKYRASTSHRVPVATPAPRGPRPGRKSPLVRRDAGHGDGRIVRSALMLPEEACQELRDARVAEFLAEGVDHG